jgi:primosomal protein N' (replication factor Y) (superfamily II helicase)
VIVQTFQPNHAAILAGARQDFRAFAAYELPHRRESFYPPFSRLVLGAIEARGALKAEEEARKIAATAQDLASRMAPGVLAVAGPFEAPIAKLRGRDRRQVLIKARGFGEVRRVVEALKPLVKLSERLRVTLDVDPVDML